MIAIDGILSQHGVPFTRKGEWVNLECPQCGKKKLGWSGTVFYCFKCGRLPFRKTLESLTGVSIDDIDFSACGGYRRVEKDTLPIRLPDGLTNEFPATARDYLAQRGFDPDYIIAKFGLRCIDWRASTLFRQRIFVPHYIGGKMVSWQLRAYAGQEPRYIILEARRELVHCRSSLYNVDSVKDGRCVVVEGITDVWKLGDGAVCTFGKDYTKEQLLALSKMREVHVLFDNEPEAQMKARRLANELDSLGVFATVNRITSAKDPGCLSVEKGEIVMKELLG